MNDHLDARPASVERAITRTEARLGRVEQLTIRVQARLEATLPYLATKADLMRTDPVPPYSTTKAERAYKPSPRWALRAAMATAYATAIGGGAVSALILKYLAHH